MGKILEPLERDQVMRLWKIYEDLGHGCGVKQDGTELPAQPNCDPNILQQHDLIDALTPELKKRLSERNRKRLFDLTCESVQEFKDSGSPTAHILSYFCLGTITPTFGIDVPNQIAVYNKAYANHTPCFHSTISLLPTSGDEPQKKEPKKEPSTKFAVYDNIISTRPDQRAHSIKHDVLRHACRTCKIRDINDDIGSLANAIIDRTVSWLNPGKGPRELHDYLSEFQWITWKASYLLLSALPPVLGQDIRGELKPESGFLEHPAGRCWKRNYQGD